MIDEKCSNCGEKIQKKEIGKNEFCSTQCKQEYEQCQCPCHTDKKLHACNHCNVFFMKIPDEETGEKKLLGQYIADLINATEKYAKELKTN